MARIELTDNQKRIREQRVIDMYQRGVSQQKISEELHISFNEIRRITKAAGIFVKGRARVLNRRTPDGYKQPVCIDDYQEGSSTQKMKRNMETAVRPEHIAAVRRIVKLGDVLKIKTDKGMTINAGSENTVHGVIRDAVVIGKENPVFCQTRLICNGVQESVMWQDIYVAWRDGKEVIGQEGAYDDKRQWRKN